MGQAKSEQNSAMAGSERTSSEQQAKKKWSGQDESRIQAVEDAQRGRPSLALRQAFPNMKLKAHDMPRGGH